MRVVDELPLNATGKVVKETLPDLGRRPADRGPAVTAPRAAPRARAGGGPRSATAIAVLAGDDRVVLGRASTTSSNAFAATSPAGGVGAGDRVAVMTANRVEFVAAVNAISKLGAAAVLLSPAWKAIEVGHAVS